MSIDSNSLDICFKLFFKCGIRRFSHLKTICLLINNSHSFVYNRKPSCELNLVPSYDSVCASGFFSLDTLLSLWIFIFCWDKILFSYCHRSSMDFVLDAGSNYKERILDCMLLFLMKTDEEQPYRWSYGNNNRTRLATSKLASNVKRQKPGVAIHELLAETQFENLYWRALLYLFFLIPSLSIRGSFPDIFGYYQLN